MNATRIKKAGKAVAGSALLVGATLTGAAGLAAASSHNSGSSGDMSGDMSLADYPTPFIGEDGTVNTAIVVGEQAATIDVVGAINIAGSLGNQAFTTEEVSAEGGSFGFSATQGVTLSNQNDNLYYGDRLTDVRDTLTQDDLTVLETVDFSDDSGDDTEIESFVDIGNRQVTYGNDPDGIDDDEDPVLHVPVPSEGDVDKGQTSGTDNFLLNMQANFEDGLDFTDEDVAGEDIQLFGTTYTIAEENEVPSDDSDNPSELILFGASETVSVATGGEGSTTTTIGGDEVTLNVDAVTDSNTAAITVNGELEEYNEDEEFTVNDETVRVDNIIQTNADNSQGTVQFSIGSEELRLEDGSTIEDGDGDEIEGTHVEFNGDSSSVSGINPEEGGQAISSIDIYLGAQDDDNDYVAAGETFEHEFFDQATFRFGGLNPDAAQSENAAEISVETNGDQEAQVSFDGEGDDSLTQDFVHVEDGDTGDLDSDFSANTDDINLADSDNDDIIVREGATVEEDDYFTADAGDFSHLYEVTSIDRDATGDLSEDDEAIIDLRDTVTGSTTEVDIDAVDEDDQDLSGSGDEFYAGTEIIDGQSYRFVVSGDSTGSDDDSIDGDDEPEFRFAYGDGSMVQVDEGINMGLYTGGLEMSSGATSLYTAVDTANNGAVSFVGDTNLDANIEAGGSVSGGLTVELPSTQSTDAKTLNIEHTNDADGSGGDEVTLTTSDGASASYQESGANDNDVDLHVTVGTVDYVVQLSGLDQDRTGSNDVTVDSVDLRDDQDSGDNFGAEASGLTVEDPTALFVQPENDDDAENAFVLTPNGYDEDDGFSFSGDDAREYTGSDISVRTLEGSDDDVEAGYNEYGTYVNTDTQDEGSVSLMLPSGQSVAGAAVTTGEGSLETGGGTGSVESQTPTGFPEGALLDSEVTSSQRQNTNHILVGGPAVNDLVSTLVDQGEADVPRAGASPPGATPADGNATDGNATEGTTETYGEGDAAIQLVEDSFADGANSLIVAGFTGEDTRQAANRLANADENPLPGQDRFTVETGQ